MSGGYQKPRDSSLSAEAAFRERELRRNQQSTMSGWPIRIEQIAWREQLFHCAQTIRREGGPSAGVDAIAPRSLSNREVGSLCGEIAEQIESGEYLPSPYRMVAIPKVGTCETRTLSIPTFADRIVGKALQRSLTCFWDKRFYRSSYGFRSSRDRFMLLADLEVAIRRSGRRFLVIDDVRRAFDSLPIDELLELHRKAIDGVANRYFDRGDRNHLMWLIERMLRGHDTARTRGIAQGAPYNPVALNVYLHYGLDKMMRGSFPHLPSFRYADNLAYLCGGITEAETVRARAESVLGTKGLKLKGPKKAVDLGSGSDAVLLGFRISWKADALHLAVDLSAWDELRSNLLQAYREDDPPQRAYEIAAGWTNDYAPGLGVDEVVRLHRTLMETGYREIGPDRIRDWCLRGKERWMGSRRRATRTYRLA